MDGKLFSGIKYFTKSAQLELGIIQVIEIFTTGLVTLITEAVAGQTPCISIQIHRCVARISTLVHLSPATPCVGDAAAANASVAHERHMLNKHSRTLDVSLSFYLLHLSHLDML